MPDPARAATKVERFRCPACSGDMEFDPESGRMKCRSCGHAEAISSPGAAMADRHPFAEAISQLGAQQGSMSEQAIQASCDGCGSVVVFEPPEVAGTCPFCGGAIVAEPKAADPLIAPDGVLPVKVTKSAAQTEVPDGWRPGGSLRARSSGSHSRKESAECIFHSGAMLPIAALNMWESAASTTLRPSITPRQIATATRHNGRGRFSGPVGTGPRARFREVSPIY